MIFSFPKFTLDADVEKTKEYYKMAKPINENCCNDCRNYLNAIAFLPQEVTSLFARLGIDMSKATEVYACCENVDGTISYNGWHHACGRIMHGESAIVQVNQSHGYFDETKVFPITDDFKIFFHEDCQLLDSNFPLPAIQLEILADMPWVISEKHNHPKNMNRRK